MSFLPVIPGTWKCSDSQQGMTSKNSVFTMSGSATCGVGYKGTKSAPSLAAWGAIILNQRFLRFGAMLKTLGGCCGRAGCRPQEFEACPADVVVTLPDLWATTFTFFRQRFLWSKKRAWSEALAVRIYYKLWGCVGSRPVRPVRAMGCPAFTHSPTSTKFLELWLYSVSIPLAWRTTTTRP